MIASWVRQLGWMKPTAGPENTAVRPSVPETPQVPAVAQTAPETVAPKPVVAPALDPEQVQQITQSLAALRQTAEQLAVGQDQMTREISRLLIDDYFGPSLSADERGGRARFQQLSATLLRA